MNSLTQQLLTQLRQPSVQQQLKALEHQRFYNIEFESYSYHETNQEHCLGFEYKWENIDEGDNGNLVSWEDIAFDDLVFQTSHTPLIDAQTLSSAWLKVLLQKLAQKAQQLDDEWNAY